MILTCLTLWLKLCFNHEYVSYGLYSKICCTKILKMHKVIVKIPNYCENKNGDIHYHFNVGYHPKIIDSNQYTYVGKYKNDDCNSNRVTEAVYWKFDDKAFCNVNRCTNIRFVIMLSLTIFVSCLLVISSATNDHEAWFVYVYACFGISLLESLCVSRLARCCIVIEVFAWFTQIVIQTDVQSDVFFDGECRRTLNANSAMMWSFVLRLFFYYGATLGMSNKESKKIAFKVLLSQMGSILDLITDLIVIYVWIIFENYYWSLFQCLILLSSQLIQIYFIIKKDAKNSKIFTKQQGQNVPHKQIQSNCFKIFDLFFIFIGLGKLWFGTKKLANVSSLTHNNDNKNNSGTNYNNNNNENNDSYRKTSFEMIKIWEFLFESFPTLLLSCYILLNEGEQGRLAVILSMIVSFSNLSLTLVRAMSKSSKRNEKSNVKVEQNMDDILFGNSNVTNTYAHVQRPSLELAHTRTASTACHGLDDLDDKTQSSCVTGQSVSQQEPTNTLELWYERPFVKQQSNSKPKSQKKWKYINYFVIWTFSVTDSFIRFVPLLMFIAFLKSIVSNFASFFIFFVIFCAIFAFEANVLINEKIIAQNPQSANYHNTNDNQDRSEAKSTSETKCNVERLIYSFYCVITGSLYLLAFIQLPYLEFNVTNASFFKKYQSIRIIFSIFVLILLFFIQLIMQIWHYNWAFLTCFVVLVIHFASFYYLVKFIIAG